MSILTIRSFYNNFSKTEKKIADFVLSKPNKIVYMSITEFAEECNVGETSIIRFCRKIGLKGYQEFKLTLAKENMGYSENIYGSDIKEGDSTSELVHKIKNNNVAAIENTVSMVNINYIEKASDKILKSDRVEIYGVGASAFTAGDLMYKLIRLGINASTYGDNHLQLMSAATLDNKSTALGISYSGGTIDTVSSLRTAKKSGAFTIAITNFIKSPITEFADIVLLTSASETPLRSGALSSKVAQLVLMDILYTVTAVKSGNKAFSNLDKTAESVLEKLY